MTQESQRQNSGAQWAAVEYAGKARFPYNGLPDSKFSVRLELSLPLTEELPT